MVLMVSICAATMLSFAVADLRLLLVAAATLDEAKAAPFPRR
jgi:hypothetical protein